MREIKKSDILKIYTDGAARGNPGPAAYSFIIPKIPKINICMLLYL